MARAFRSRIGEFTEMHSVLVLSLSIIFGIPILSFLLTLTYRLIFSYRLGPRITFALRKEYRDIFIPTC